MEKDSMEVGLAGKVAKARTVGAVHALRLVEDDTAAVLFAFRIRNSRTSSTGAVRLLSAADASDTAIVSRGLSLFLRSVVLVVALGCATHFVVNLIQRSDWNKERLYRKLMSGNANQQSSAAGTLVYVEGEKQLLAALKAEKAEVRDTARRALEYLWFIREGNEAFELMQAAAKAYERESYQEALDMLDKLIAQHPRYAEAWNRRACVYWKMERYDESIADCERVLTLNPNHYGAWQGLGVCKLHQGDVEEAVRCLKTVLRITPYDESVSAALKKCEDLLQNIPPSKYRQREETV